MSAYVFASLFATQSQAQLMDGLVYPDGRSVVGSAAVMSDTGYDGEAVMAAAQQSVYVGPGGETSAANVPSVLGPGAESPQSWQTNGWPNRRGVPVKTGTQPNTRLVSQPYANGPFLQGDPVVADSGYAIPCPCDDGCDFTYYGSAEALYFRRDYDERFTLLPNSPMDQFDYEWGGRVTVGRVYDCVNGYEGVFAGGFKWRRSGFNQGWTARLNTYEMNRRWWAWDMFSLLVGLRFVDYRENYGVISSPGGVNTTILDRTRNAMIGPQIGGEIMQPLGMRTLLGFKGKGALLANFARNEIFISTAPPFPFMTDSDVEVAGLFEVGSFVKYNVTRSISLNAGYELWFIPGAATVPAQLANVGSKVNTDDDLLFHGATFGGQILY